MIYIVKKMYGKNTDASNILEIFIGTRPVNINMIGNRAFITTMSPET